MKNIAVFFGGKSCEHDISIITGFQVVKNLDLQKYNVYPIYIDKNGEWHYIKHFNSVENFLKGSSATKVFVAFGNNNFYLNKSFKKKLAKINCGIIACHGMNGEDGTLQGVLELLNIPYSTGSVMSSSLTMDKVFMKQIFEVNNLPVVPYYYFNSYTYSQNQDNILKEIQKTLEFPLIVKPANLGSSIGIKKCQNLQELKTAIQVALNYDNKILVEEVVQHLIEINCAVLGFENDVEISQLEQPISWNNFLSFEEKYLQFQGVKFEKNKTIKISKELKNKIKKMSKYAFQKFDCSGVVRIDFLINQDTEEIFINEINSTPGSFANYLFSKFSFTELLNKVICCAEKKFNKKQKCSFTYDTDVLKKFKNGNNLIKIK